jgi:chemotaxis-related protein WspB
MLMLLFYLDTERYALNSKQVIEVAPLVELKKQPHTPNYVAGVFNYRGQIVPVIDLCQLIQGRACHAHLSTRIILVNYLSNPLSNGKTISSSAGRVDPHAELLAPHPFTLGLMAERVVETVNVAETDLVDARIRVETAPYLGQMVLDQRGMIQCIQIENLLTQEQRSHLFATHDAVSP